ncbi:MAG TPA: hypothetical protein VLA56_16470 [Pseudomonadales bacterium]|nr:hypothetical protein [Pseudomonadales bacterium]
MNNTSPEIPSTRDAAFRGRGALVTRPLPVPAEVPQSQVRRWELFAPVLNSCVAAAIDTARATLLEDAEGTLSEERRRLSFLAARELGARLEGLAGHTSAALVRLYLDPQELASAWRSEVGSFGLQQLSERLARAHGSSLVALGRRLHGSQCTALDMAERLAGLLTAAIDGERLSAHARNVVCTFYARHLENVLPGIAGRLAEPRDTSEETTRRNARDDDTVRAPIVPAEGRSSAVIAPRPVMEALRDAQLLALENDPITDLVALVCERLATTRAPYDPVAADRCIDAIDDIDRQIAAVSALGTLPRLVMHALHRLRPVLVQAALVHGARDPWLDALVGALCHGSLDLEERLDPRAELLDEICGDVLACYRGIDGELAVLVDDAVARLRQMNGRLGEIRHRARARALADRRRAAARSAADAICERLARRADLRPFLASAWHTALLQAHVRYGMASSAWQRMQTLGQTLLMADGNAFRRLRPALADALGLSIAESVTIEQHLDALQRTLDEPADPTILPSGAEVDTAGLDLTPIADAHPWLLADGGRRWLLVQPREGAGEVLLTDARARTLEWRSAEVLRREIASGTARPLISSDALNAWMVGRV